MDDIVVFVEKPATFRIESGLVRAEIESSGTTIHLAMSIHTFLEIFARCAITAKEWSIEQNGKAVEQLDEWRG